MTIRNLDRLFAPRAVAVIGAASGEDSIGGVAMRNLLQGGFRGPVLPVTARERSVRGVMAFKSVEDLPEAPDLAVLCATDPPLSEQVARIGARGVSAAVVLAEPPGAIRTPAHDNEIAEAVKVARDHGVRLLGPRSFGVAVPSVGLNASLWSCGTAPGRVAFVSQSRAIAASVVDWAVPAGVGFSHFVSTGDDTDISVGDVVDYLATNGRVGSIIIYLEHVKHRRTFMSAARAAARNKPILVVKAGTGGGASAGGSHTAALIGQDDVFEAAIRRSGMLRVRDLGELLPAVQTLDRCAVPRGGNLAIVTNSVGLGELALDRIRYAYGELAHFSMGTLMSMAELTRGGVSDQDGVMLLPVDAPPTLWRGALAVLREDQGIDATLLIHAPGPLVDSTEVARVVIEEARDLPWPILCSFVGGAQVAEARQLLGAARLPLYATPGYAINALSHLTRYRDSQRMLTEIPRTAPEVFTRDTASARAVVERVLEEDRPRGMLTDPEAKAVLAAYGVPVARSEVAPDPDTAARAAARIGFPAALKLLSRDVTHKSDVGGVVLGLADENAVREAAQGIIARVKAVKPLAVVDGFIVQPMIDMRGAHELIVGAATDRVFGPVILFGQGGLGVEVVRDRAVALPPLTMVLADDLIDRTRVARLLSGYRGRKPADREAIRLTLLRISQLVEDFPEIQELDINPLVASERGVVALDARIRVARTEVRPGDHLAIRPYPEELEERWTLKDGRRALIRPIRPDDERRYADFMRALDTDDIHTRFFGMVREIPHDQLARMTQIDYDREMALVAIGDEDGHEGELWGEVRVIADPDNREAEYAVIVRSDLKGQGLGWKLMNRIIDHARARGTGRIIGEVLNSNVAMLNMDRRLGFRLEAIPGEDYQEVTLDLRAE